MTTETSSSSVQNKRIIWFYQADSNSNEQIEWKQYSDYESDFIEEAFQKNEEEIAFDDCVINFKDSMRFNKNDKNQRCNMKRQEVNVNDLVRNERFSYPEKAIQIKSFESKFKWNIINQWLNKNQTVKNDFTAVSELAALGILEEGRLLNKNLLAERMADELRTCIVQNQNLKSHYRDTAIKKCATYLYSVESFLYNLVNSTLRNNDLSKLDTLGPFCHLLSKYLPFKCPDGYRDYTVYRGTSLSEEMIKEYRTAIGRRIVWPAFTSTTKDRQVAEFFSDNALCIIEVNGRHSQGVRNISSISKYPQEQEVLFCAGQSFILSKIEYDSTNEKYLIYMST